MMSEIKDSADVVIDNVGGDGFPDMIDALKRGGRYATSGAIAGRCYVYLNEVADAMNLPSGWGVFQVNHYAIGGTGTP